MKNRAIKVSIFFTILILLGIAYYFVTYLTGLYIPCYIRLITGFRCPGCGISHMIINIFHMNFKAAYMSNQLLFLTSPIIIAMIAREVYCYIRYDTHETDKCIEITAIILIVLFLIFAVLRNIFGF